MSHARHKENDEEFDFIKIHYLSDSEKETVVQVLKRNESLRSKEKNRIKRIKDELHELETQNAHVDAFSKFTRSCPRCGVRFALVTRPGIQCCLCEFDVCKSCSLIFQNGAMLLCVSCYKQILCDSKSTSWLNLKRISAGVSSSSLNKDEKSSDDFLGVLLEKIAESLPAVVEQSPGDRDQEKLTYSVYNVSTKKFLDSPPSNVSPPEFEEELPTQLQTEEELAETREAEETPEILKFLQEHQAKCWPPPVGNGMGPFGHPIFQSAPEEKPPKDEGMLQVDQVDTSWETSRFSECESELLNLHSSSVVPSSEGSSPNFLTADYNYLTPDYNYLESAPPVAYSAPYSGAGSVCSTLDRSVSRQGFQFQLSQSSAPGGLYSASVNNMHMQSGIEPGAIKLLLYYSYKNCSFVVHVVECRNLPVGDLKRCRTDSYIKTCLLPDKTRNSKKKTKIKKNTSSPLFDEKLLYSVGIPELESRKLQVTAMHSTELLQTDVCLGQVDVPITIPLLDDKEARWYILSPPIPKRVSPIPPAHAQYKGEISISLKYVTPSNLNITDLSKVSSKGELHIYIREAKNLSSNRIGHQEVDPYVKLHLLPDRSNHSKRKTPSVRKCCSPIWNLVIKFEDITQKELQKRGLELTVWDSHKLLGHRAYLGGVIFCNAPQDGADTPTWMTARGDEVRIWKTALSRPDRWVDGTFHLRDCLQTASQPKPLKSYMRSTSSAL